MSRRSVDVKNPAGRDIVRDLAKGADVFIQNFRPGVVNRLGVGESDIRAVAPDIIYTSISGFGEEGRWVGKPVYDPIIQAISGLTTVQAGSDQERPRLIRTVLPDKLAAVTAALPRTYPETLPALCNITQLPLGSAWDRHHLKMYTSEYKGRLYNFDSFLLGQIQPMNLGGGLQWMGITPEVLGDDAYAYRWAAEYAPAARKAA